MLSPTLITFLTAMVPVAERGAIPLGIKLGLSPFVSFALVTLGNGVVVLFLLWLFHYGSVWLTAHIPVVQKILAWAFKHTRDKHGSAFASFGFVALALFVAIPSPLTGIWTASVISYLLAMPIKKAFFAILIGGAAANLLVLGATVGIITFLKV